MKAKQNLYTTPVLDTSKLGKYSYSRHMSKGILERIMESRILWNIVCIFVIGGFAIVSFFQKITDIAKKIKA